MMKKFLSAVAMVGLAACGGSASSGGDGGTDAGVNEAKANAGVKAYINTNLVALKAASVAIQTAAPSTPWNATTDAAAIATMKTEWKKARIAYEHIEGAIAVLFPELDATTDQRYDVFINDKGADLNLFDDVNVTGIHAIERILYSDVIPASVKTFEMGLTGHKVAAFPATAAEATDFKTKLCDRMVKDVQKMTDQFGTLTLDSATAFRGVIGSMGEQIEKLQKAESGEEESRYAQFTLADMRANVAAGKATYALFKPWVLEKGGSAEDTAITAAFSRVDAAYDAITGDALPAVPATWSSASPSATDLMTPFGKLYSALKTEANPMAATSLVTHMGAAADKMGIPKLPE